MAQNVSKTEPQDFNESECNDNECESNDLLSLTSTVKKKRTNALNKNLKHVFLVKHVKKQRQS